MQHIEKSKKINLAIDGGDFAPNAQVKSGIQRVADSLIRFFPNDKTFHVNYYYFSREEKSFTQSIKRNITFTRLPKRGYSRFFLPFFIIKDKNNWFLGLSSFIPAVLKLFNIKSIDVIYDLGFIKNPGLYANINKISSFFMKSLKRADVLMVPSQETRRNINKFFPLLMQPKKLNYLGVDHFKLSVNKIDKKKIGNYFLFIGVIKPIKDIEKLIHIYADFLESGTAKLPDLVMIGNKENTYYKQINKLKDYIHHKEKMIFLEDVSDKNLYKYMRNAIAVLNTSKEEGFCFPVLESLSLGKKVIVNNLRIYHEFTHMYNNLYITKNSHDFIKMMKYALKYKKDVPSRFHFTWINFILELKEIMIH